MTLSLKGKTLAEHGIKNCRLLWVAWKLVQVRSDLANNHVTLAQKVNNSKISQNHFLHFSMHNDVFHIVSKYLSKIRYVN